ncbi:MAG: TIGR03936 family radical SAM-associated protein [Candidatus Ozemobacteraceae bacterium]
MNDPAAKSPPATIPECRFRLIYRKTGVAIYMSHLDSMNALIRALRRSGLPYLVTQGCHPRPRCSFGPALSLGHSGAGEVMDIWIAGPADAGMVRERLAGQMPHGMPLLRVEGLPANAKAIVSEAPMSYRLRFRQGADAALALAEDFFRDSERIISVHRSDGTRRQSIAGAVRFWGREPDSEAGDQVGEKTVCMIVEFAKAGNGIPSASKIVAALAEFLGSEKDALVETERVAIREN